MVTIKVNRKVTRQQPLTPVAKYRYVRRIRRHVSMTVTMIGYRDHLVAEIVV